MILQLWFYPVGCSCQWFFVFRVEVAAVGLKSTPALEATTEVVLSLSKASVCITGVITFSVDQNPWTKPMVTLHTSEPVFCSVPREILTSQVSSYLGMASWVSPGEYWLSDAYHCLTFTSFMQAIRKYRTVCFLRFCGMCICDADRYALQTGPHATRYSYPDSLVIWI